MSNLNVIDECEAELLMILPISQPRIQKCIFVAPISQSWGSSDLHRIGEELELSIYAPFRFQLRFFVWKLERVKLDNCLK